MEPCRSRVLELVNANLASLVEDATHIICLHGPCINLTNGSLIILSLVKGGENLCGDGSFF